jgi:quinol monooxygenase YgiN
MIIVAGWVDVAPNERDRFLAERRDKALLTRREPGLSADSVDRARVRVFECWEDQAAIDARQAKKSPPPAGWVRAVAKEITSYEVDGVSSPT